MGLAVLSEKTAIQPKVHLWLKLSMGLCAFKPDRSKTWTPSNPRQRARLSAQRAEHRCQWLNRLRGQTRTLSSSGYQPLSSQLSLQYSSCVVCRKQDGGSSVCVSLKYFQYFNLFWYWMKWLHINNYVIVNNSDTCFINIYGVLPSTPTLIIIYSAYCLVQTLT